MSARGQAGYSLVEAMVAGALLMGLAFVVVQFTDLGLRGSYTSDSRIGFESLASAIALSIESQEGCTRQLEGIRLTAGGTASVLGGNEGPQQKITLTPPGYASVHESPDATVVGAYSVGRIELRSLQVLEDDAAFPGAIVYTGSLAGALPQTAVTLSMLRVDLVEDPASGKPVRSLGQPRLSREFYLQTVINKADGRVISCRSGRYLSDEELVTPELAALPARKGLRIVQLNEGSQPPSGATVAWGAPQKCAAGSFTAWAQGIVHHPAHGPPFRWRPYYPNSLLEIDVSSASTQVMDVHGNYYAAPIFSLSPVLLPTGGVHVDPADHATVKAYSTGANLAQGTRFQQACLGIGTVADP